MSDRPHLEPGPGHPITIEPSPKHVTVRRGGELIAETDSALDLREADYPPVFYVPLADVREGALEPNGEQHTYCPFKGEASYYDLTLGGERLQAAVWTYPAPYPAVAEIAGHVAFYPDRVEIDAG